MVRALAVGVSLGLLLGAAPTVFANEVTGPSIACSMVAAGPVQWGLVQRPELSEPGTSGWDAQWKSVFFVRSDTSIAVSFDRACQPDVMRMPWEDQSLLESWTKSKAQIRLSVPGRSDVIEEVPMLGEGSFSPEGYFYRTRTLGELLPGISPQQRLGLSYRLMDGRTAQWSEWTDVQPRQPSWGPLTLEWMNQELSAPVVSVAEEVGALDVSWSVPSVRPIMTGPNSNKLTYGISWYRDGRQVGTAGTSWDQREPTSTLIDGLTMTQRYRVCVSAFSYIRGYMPVIDSPKNCVAGTALLPASLRVLAPRTVRANEPIPISVRAASKGRRVVKGHVRLTLRPKSPHKANSRTLRTVKLDRTGKAKTILRFKKSGTLSATLKPRGPFDAVTQSRKVRVR